MVKEEMVLFDNIYAGKRVFVTGHTGFKGSWLVYWLRQLNAKIMGYSLPPPTAPNHFDLLDLDIVSVTADVRDRDTLQQTLVDYQPDIVFHLAGQAIVRRSYEEPLETFTTNTLGTINALEACRLAGSVKAMVAITSDKCYDNREWPWGYKENDPVGGFDPYSASKGCAELVIACWRNSYFNLEKYGSEHQTLLSSARAGNVIGGGDWAPDRLIPDIMRAVNQNEKVKIRNPHAARPWQHVLEPLSGYLLLGQKLLEGRKEFAEAWNFGPSEEENMSVAEIVNQAKQCWPQIDYEVNQAKNQPHEATILRLDCSKACAKLQWLPVWNGKDTIEKTAAWYRAFYESGEVLSFAHLKSYIEDAQNKHISWTKQ